MESRFYRFCRYTADIRIIYALRRSFTLVIPLIIISMVALSIQTFPNQSYQTFLVSKNGLNLNVYLKIISHVTFSYITLILAFLIGYCYSAKTNNSRLYNVTLGLTSVLCFMIFVALDFNKILPDYFLPKHPYETIPASLQNFSMTGLLPCLLSCAVCCPLFTFILNRCSAFRHSTITQPIQIVLTTLPAIIVCLSFFIFLQFILHYFDMSAQSLYDKVNATSYGLMVKYADHEYIEAILFNLTIQVLNFFGIHGNFFLYEIADHYYSSVLSENIYTGIFGSAEQYKIITSSFNNLFVSLGGSGCIAGLFIAIIVKSKNKMNRNLIPITLIPSICNISEILTYGIPVIFNPVFFIPFITAPVVNTTVAYLATKAGFIPIILEQSSVMEPVFVSGWVTTHSVNVVLLQVILIIIDTLIYIPFLNMDESYRNKAKIRYIRDLEDFIRRNETEREKPNFFNLTEDLTYTIQELIYDLRSDLENKNLFMVYQPQFDYEGHIIGAESLLRWHHEKAGLIYPPLIIALAKEGQFLPLLETFIFNATAQTIKDIRTVTDREIKISANVTGSSMQSETFEAMISKAVEKNKISASSLWIEVTEQDAITSAEKLEKLKAKGHKIVIDDFGMGHTSIRYLETALFDMVKLDGSITRGVSQNPRNQDIIKSIVDLSKKFGMQVVAEYVENEEQKNALYSLGCDLFQGSLYSMPVSKEMLLASL